MARLAYSLLFYLATPLIWLRLLWRARRQPAYLQHLPERYGFYPPLVRTPLIWLHAVSVGETRAAAPLIDALLRAYPAHRLLLTHMTPTGRDTGRELLTKHPDRILQAYLPYDLPDACVRFFAHFQPQLGVLMETELWPNLLATAQKKGTPVVLVNARLSERSQRGYSRFAALARPTVKALASVAAQTPADAQRLRDIGALQVSVLGNLKFDVTPDTGLLALGADWKQNLAPRLIWLAASTREGEEILLLDALVDFWKSDIANPAHSKPLLLLVPRHPQRFDEVAHLLRQRGITHERRSSGRLPGREIQVWLGDSMGEMAAYYAAADLALIGGSLQPFGGQNLIEAAACGCPVLVGPHTFNFAQAADDAIACGAARRVQDAGEAVRLACTWLQDGLQNDAPAVQTLTGMRQAALSFSAAHRGATQKTVALLRAFIPPQTGR